MIDDKDKIVVGNTIPEVTYSFGVHMGWKGLSLEAQFQGVGEVYTYPRANLAVPFNNGAGVTRDWATDSWTESNRHSKLPLLTTYTDAPENFIPSTKWAPGNASYLRMKNIQLTYDFPKRLLRPLRIEALQIYVSGQNLWTISDFDLWDPEITTTRTDLYEYPNLKTVSIGLNPEFLTTKSWKMKKIIYFGLSLLLSAAAVSCSMDFEPTALTATRPSGTAPKTPRAD